MRSKWSMYVYQINIIIKYISILLKKHNTENLKRHESEIEQNFEKVLTKKVILFIYSLYCLRLIMMVDRKKMFINSQ